MLREVCTATQRKRVRAGLKETHSMPSERSLGKLTDSKAKFSIWGWKAIQELLPRGQTTKESGHRAGVRLA